VTAQQGMEFMRNSGFQHIDHGDFGIEFGDMRSGETILVDTTATKPPLIKISISIKICRAEHGFIKRRFNVHFSSPSYFAKMTSPEDAIAIFLAFAPFINAVRSKP